jgi:phosphoglycerol transferase MdoB-like AlkP superfamily enzyme
MGMEQNRMAYLGHMGRREGYDTIFLQSSVRQSFHVDSIAAMAGFTTYLGAENIPVSGHSETGTERGAWDHDMLQEASRHFARARQPFLGFVFTASTHVPFQSPGARWQKFAPDSLEHRYLNSLFYADWALGEFIQSAKAAGYYHNTIFVLTADHISGFAGKSGDAPSLHHVPLLVIAPGLKPGVNHRTGGQVDVIPTLIQLAGWRIAHAGLGRSLLDGSSREPRGTLTVRGDVIERIEDAGWVAHDLEKRIAAAPNTPEPVARAMEERLLAMYQVAHTLLMQNRVNMPEQELATARAALTRRLNRRTGPRE